MQFIIDTGNDPVNESAVRKELYKFEKNLHGVRFTEKDHKTNLFFDYAVILNSETPSWVVPFQNDYRAFAAVIVAAEKFKADCNIELLQQKINEHINLLKTQIQEDTDA